MSAAYRPAAADNGLTIREDLLARSRHLGVQVLGD